MPPDVSVERPPFGMDAREVFAALGSEPEKGLRGDQLPGLRARFGFNELTKAAPDPVWKKFFRHFNELVIWILIAASLVSGVVGDTTDAVVIVAIVVLNGLLGFFQEQRAEQAFGELEKLSSPTAKVIRNGIPLLVPARELLPGDELELEAGDVVPADARLLVSHGLRVHEASLTGESIPVDKTADILLKPDTPLGDRRNMVYSGTSVSSGRATAVVTQTGMATELGKIAKLLEEAAPEPTPLQKRITQLGRTLVAICVVLIAVTFGLQLIRGGKLLEVFLLAVSLAVAAIPEGLPAAVTVALAVGLRRMAKRMALIRSLSSVESLGSVTVICSDKTGTLTRNQMMVRRAFAGGRHFLITGEGYEPTGQFFELGHSEPIVLSSDESSDLLNALTVGARCNHARLISPASEAKTSGWGITGDPTEAALLVAALKGGLNVEPTGYRILDELPFDSARKYMSVTILSPSGKLTSYCKGAVEAVLPMCAREHFRNTTRALDDERRKAILEVSDALAAGGLRVLALASLDLESPRLVTSSESALVFAGLVGMWDPPREEAKSAVADCFSAGIRPVMITGDHPSTAVSIAMELGITKSDEAVLSGRELDTLSDDELSRRVTDIAVFARVTAAHKLRIVSALKKRNQVVAMTGDGVNDAPAIKAADIGIAMGVTGTDVTKQAADLVLLDDNFATIVAAVEQGRGILDNIQKFLHYLLSGNAAELLVMFVATLVGWPFPLLATQILWINLVTDGLPALALSLEPVESTAMQRGPRALSEPILDPKRGLLILLHAFLIAAVVLAAFAITYADDVSRLANARSTAFATLAFSQILFALSCRSDNLSLASLGALSNPWLLAAAASSALLQLAVMMIPTLRDWFDVSSVLSGEDWARIALFSVAPFLVIECTKWFRSRLKRR